MFVFMQTQEADSELIKQENTPALTVIISQGDFKGEYIMDERIFKSFDEALQNFIHYYRSQLFALIIYYLLKQSSNSIYI